MALIEIILAIPVVLLVALFFSNVYFYSKWSSTKEQAEKDKQLRENAQSGLINIQGMLLNYKEDPDPQLCKLIQQAINNWNNNFSAMAGQTLPNITCP